ncbi:hypothetical protein GQ457_11G028770 [Hibiscus cannabinus]
MFRHELLVNLLKLLTLKAIFGLFRLHLSIDTSLWVSIPLVITTVGIFFTGEYRYPNSSIDTLSCRSAFIAGRKLPNGSIDDLTYQNGWKSVRGYKNKLLKL